jgi:hypothetical protein
MLMSIMENSIVIPVSHIKFLIPGYKQRISEINDLVEKLLGEKSELVSVLAQYSDEVDIGGNIIEAAHKQESNYDPDSSWWAKVKYILLQSESALTTAEVVDGLISMDNKIDRSKAIRIVSSTLGTKAKSGILRRLKVDGKDQKFALAK